MKTPHHLVASLLALAAASAFAACSSVDPSPAQIGVDPATLDAGVDACVGESNTELVKKACDDAGKECGTATVKDRCGVDQTVACGSFGGGCDQNSATKNFCNTATSTCECKDSRTDAEVVSAFCTASAKNCGDPGAKDRCGLARAGSCGTCDAASGAVCGASTNVCECSGGKYACGTTCVRNCLEGCSAAANACEDTKRCVTVCDGVACSAGHTAACTTFSRPTGRSQVCTDLPDGGACATFSAACTTAADCGFTASRAIAVCVLGDAGPGECFYCGAPGTNGLPCGGVGTCVAATRTCQ
jgi:hypothetical protein